LKIKKNLSEKRVNRIIIIRKPFEIESTMWKLVVLLAASLCTCSAYTRFTKCGSPTDNYVMSAKIGDCTRPPCVTKANTNLTVEIDFYSSHKADTLRMLYYMTFSVGGTETMKAGPMEGPDVLDACTGNGIECPIRAGGRYLYTRTFFVGENVQGLENAIGEVKMLSIGGRNKNFVARQVFCIQYAIKFED